MEPRFKCAGDRVPAAYRAQRERAALGTLLSLQSSSVRPAHLRCNRTQLSGTPPERRAVRLERADRAAYLYRDATARERHAHVYRRYRFYVFAARYLALRRSGRAFALWPRCGPFFTL